MTTEAFADLSGLESLIQSQEQGIEIDILNERGEPIGLKIGFVGPDSDRTQKAMRDVASEFAKKAAERSSLEPATDDSDDRMIAILAKSTTHWSPNPKIGGQVVPFSEENVRNLYSKFRIIRDQIEVRAVRRSSFTKS
ncbi:hypothetical protein [Rhizobium leguminosarum]|jgi:hypothetical protein|uniref:Uncharacterized protein n=1 Tax=Rhizobium leguminosarum bv. viciae TaxID=387 RepID=A0A7G6RJB1_RHILV|nr:hypothetical protein [Rhizobium leguminosarum]ASS57577.1 hypothetical protein CHR56_25165 [Rhizobium leguminosarum bv. viciae]QND42343.1 hypothetical protein HB770_11125 [Rhizobium leguminosarum bv. viciae]TBY17501.1 hypothetical protein E0H30_26130 [Rhizobium leguminosarum bv. viciae]TBY24610.1 hypothetical protein E0H37_23090 [Rhizobium leguminosarum bv. viciae]TBY99726.1 hypothetical protein E0H49_17590 [Rhizobium leguminosarum bv. viciae]